MDRYDLIGSYWELIKIRDKYEEIYKADKKKEAYPAPKITIASYLAGERFYADPKLLVIGRALNGWMVEYNGLDADATVNKWETHEKAGFKMEGRYVRDSGSYVKVTKEQCRGLEWVETYLEKGSEKNGRKRKKKTGSEAFWKAVRYAVYKLYGDVGDEYTKYVAWTNLMKACPQSGGNPTGALWNEQIDICNRILKQEAEILKPTHILVIAKKNTSDKSREDGWIEPFKKTLDEFEAKGIKVMYLRRPEFKKDVDIKKEVDQAFGG